MENYRDYLASFGIMMNDADWAIYEPRIIKESFKKNEIITQQGSVENYISLIESGAARLYLEKEEREITVDFAFENGYVTAYESFLTRQPSSYTIQALTDVVLWRSSHEDCQHFFEHTSIGNFIGRVSAEMLYLIKAERELAFITETAEERYLKLLSKQPDLLQRVPLKYISSYIGVTPQALSRIRRRIC